MQNNSHLNRFVKSHMFTSEKAEVFMDTILGENRVYRWLLNHFSPHEVAQLMLNDQCPKELLMRLPLSLVSDLLMLTCSHSKCLVANFILAAALRVDLKVLQTIFSEERYVELSYAIFGVLETKSNKSTNAQREFILDVVRICQLPKQSIVYKWRYHPIHLFVNAETVQWVLQHDILSVNDLLNLSYANVNIVTAMIEIGEYIPRRRMHEYFIISNLKYITYLVDEFEYDINAQFQIGHRTTLEKMAERSSILSYNPYYEHILAHVGLDRRSNTFAVINGRRHLNHGIRNYETEPIRKRRVEVMLASKDILGKRKRHS